MHFACYFFIMTTGKQTQTDSHSPDPSFPHQQMNKQILSTRLRHPDVRCTDLWFLFSLASWVGPSLTWCPGPPATSHVYSTLTMLITSGNHISHHTVWQCTSLQAITFHITHVQHTVWQCTSLQAITFHITHVQHTVWQCTSLQEITFHITHVQHTVWQCTSLQAITFHITHVQHTDNAHHFRQSHFTSKTYLSLKATVSHYEYLHFASSSNCVRQGFFYAVKILSYHNFFQSAVY